MYGGMSLLEYAWKVVRGMRGIHPRECPCCGYKGLFRAAGMPPRFDAECPECGSLERHRLFVLESERLHLFAASADVLHFAPERALETYIRKQVTRYVTADITGVGVDRKESIENTSFADGVFDAVVSCHVFEHVSDDRAMTEMYRVLRSGGMLLCMVPIVEGWDSSYENGAVRTPMDRELHFGQADHVRYYGRDFRARLHQARFSVNEYTAGGEESVRFGLLRGEKLFVARKQ